MITPDLDGTPAQPFYVRRAPGCCTFEPVYDHHAYPLGYRIVVGRVCMECGYYQSEDDMHRAEIARLKARLGIK